MSLFGFGSPRRRNSKKSRLNRKLRQIAKLERKFNSPKAKKNRALDAALAAADKKLQSLRGKF